MEHFGAALYLGVPGGGKSTLPQLLELVMAPQFSDGSMQTLEMSGIVKWGSGLSDSLGAAIRAEQPRMDRGFFLSDPVAIELFRRRMSKLKQEKPNVRLWHIVGVPRTPDQLGLLDMFSLTKIFWITVSDEAARQSIKGRAEESSPEERRVDDDPEAVENRLQEHKKTLEVRTLLKGRMCDLQRETLLSTTLLRMIDYLRQEPSSIPPYVARHARKAVLNPHHHVHDRIQKIVNKSPKGDVPDRRITPPLAPAIARALNQVHIPMPA